MVDKYQIKGLEKIVNSEIVKSIYPMIKNIEVISLVDEIGMIILKIYVKDLEMDEKNMYKRGLDPHYLTDYHFYNYFPYLDIPRNIKIGHIVIGPTGEHISKYLP